MLTHGTPPTEHAGRGRRHGLAPLIKLGVRTMSFVARIGMAITPSLQLFASLGFWIVGTIALFDGIKTWVVNACVIEAGPRERYESIPDTICHSMLRITHVVYLALSPSFYFLSLG